MNENLNTLYTAKEVCKRLNICYATALNLLQSGKLKARKIGYVWKITEQACLDYERRKNTGYNPDEVGERLGITYRAVLKLLKSGKLKGEKMENEWKISEDDLIEYLSGFDN